MGTNNIPTRSLGLNKRRDADKRDFGNVSFLVGLQYFILGSCGWDLNAVEAGII
ncbi:MAG: hypothetical protein AOA66_0292 [Candidatus Bathyarchaeota archaeon BA2]|nr:MAG: hypothetical protein AOA66_0292 [Candidatus Bathyarchaeota archaeon BA2]